MRVLELNDVGIRLLDANSIIAEHPGVAAVEAGRLLTGEAAGERQRIDPRSCHDRFWYQLDTSLDAPMAQATTAADIAYLQLLSFGDALTEQPLLIAAAASFSPEQLSIALGLLKTAGAEVLGLFDPAVVAASLIDTDLQVLHLDVQRHRFCVTVIEQGQAQLRRRQVIEHKPGLSALQDRCAAVFAEAFVRHSRIDPLHSAESEQRLHDSLPGWIARLAKIESLTCELGLGQRKARATIERADVQNALQGRFDDLTATLRPLMDTRPSRILLSDRAASLPGLARHWQVTEEVPAIAVAAAALRRSEQIISDPQAFDWVCQFPLQGKPAKATNAATPHLLIGNRASPLLAGCAAPLSGWLAGAPGRLHRDGSSLRLEASNSEGLMINDEPVAGIRPLRPGDRITFGEQQALVIEVAEGR